jgi:hypothetical protein
MRTSEPASQCGARHGWFVLPRASACGRARLSALRRGTFQLRAALSETESGRFALLQRAPRAPAVVPERQGPKPPECSLRNRTQAPRSLHQTVRHRLTPLMSERRGFYSAANLCQAAAAHERLSIDSAALFTSAAVVSLPLRHAISRESNELSNESLNGNKCLC